MRQKGIRFALRSPLPPCFLSFPARGIGRERGRLSLASDRGKEAIFQRKRESLPFFARVEREEKKSERKERRRRRRGRRRLKALSSAAALASSCQFFFLSFFFLSFFLSCLVPFFLFLQQHRGRSSQERAPPAFLGDSCSRTAVTSSKKKKKTDGTEVVGRKRSGQRRGPGARSHRHAARPRAQEAGTDASRAARPQRGGAVGADSE